MRNKFRKYIARSWQIAVASAILSFTLILIFALIGILIDHYHEGKQWEELIKPYGFLLLYVGVGISIFVFLFLCLIIYINNKYPRAYLLMFGALGFIIIYMSFNNDTLSKALYQYIGNLMDIKMFGTGIGILSFTLALYNMDKVERKENNNPPKWNPYWRRDLKK